MTRHFFGVVVSGGSVTACPRGASRAYAGGARFAAFGNGRMVKVFVQLTTAFHSGNKGVNNISRQDVDHTYLASMADLRVPIHSPFSGHGAEVPVTTRTARLRSAFALRKAGSSLYAQIGRAHV